MFAVGAVGDDAAVIPFSNGVGGVFVGRADFVGGAGFLAGLQAAFPVVVDELAFDAGFPAGVVGFIAAVDDAGVSLGGEFPIELEFEVIELGVGFDIAETWRDAGEDAILGFPAGKRFLLIGVPAGGGLSVEEELPTRGFLGVGKDVFV